MTGLWVLCSNIIKRTNKFCKGVKVRQNRFIFSVFPLNCSAFDARRQSRAVFLPFSSPDFMTAVIVAAEYIYG